MRLMATKIVLLDTLFHSKSLNLNTSMVWSAYELFDIASLVENHYLPNMVICIPGFIILSGEIEYHDSRQVCDKSLHKHESSGVSQLLKKFPSLKFY